MDVPVQVVARLESADEPVEGVEARVAAIGSIVDARGLRQVSDTAALESVIDQVIAENPGPVEQYRGGKEGALNALIGPVMKKTGGSANPKVVRDLLAKRLSG